MDENQIIIKDLSYQYSDGTQALSKLSLEIPIKEKTAILGANGCGKSTLLYLLNGLFLPSEGEIWVQGRKITKKTASIIRQGTGLLFDKPDNQVFSPTVRADVSFGPTNLRYTKEKIEDSVQKSMKAVEIEHLADKSPYNLSLGQKKRCAIAGVLATEPKLLLMDEPFSGLDPTSLRQFLDILDQLFQQGVGQIMSTHDVDLAYSWADRIIVMREGSLLCMGGTELLENAELMKDARLAVPLLTRIFQGTGRSFSTAEEANQFIRLLSSDNKY